MQARQPPPARSFLWLLLAGSLAGCSDGGGPLECGDGYDANEHEDACAKATYPDAEVCHAFLNGSADEEVSCEAVSDDGEAWLEWTQSTTGHSVVDVTDGAGNEVFHGALETGGAPGRLEGAEGTWTLSVNFQDASGSARVVLWG